MEFHRIHISSPLSSYAPTHLVILLLLLMSYFPCQSTASTTNSATDRLTLLSFKSSLFDPLGALSSWNETNHFCEWQGVTCGHRHPHRVTALDLDSLNLTGPIPPILANLTFLQRIHLPSNQFHGYIPQELGQLFRLRHLNLSVNYLEGKIPDSLTHCSNLQIINLRNNMLQGEIPANFSNCPGLQVINLRNNMLTGEIPHELGSLSNLLALVLSFNNFNGVIPPAIGNLSSLTGLPLAENSLEGSIPDSLGSLKSLQDLDLTSNKLSGQIPTSLYNLSSIFWFGVGNNQLVGTLPHDLGNTLPNLQGLILFWNQFEGPIPSSLCNASGLRVIDLAGNKLSGLVPSNLGTLQNLQELSIGSNQLEARKASDWSFLTSLSNCSLLEMLDLYNNKLQGILPSSIANLSTHLKWLAIGGNQISGSIPAEIESLTNLTVLYMEQNLLTGNIPVTLGMLQRLQLLYLSGNRLSGQIPSSLGSLNQLNELHLQENDFQGSIPLSFEKLTSLVVFNVSYNKLNGTIPKVLVSLSSLSQALDLSHNLFSGSLPMEVGNLKNLGRLDVSANQLSGEIPSTIGDCQVLEYLYMHDNFFQGRIPPSLGNLQGIKELDLSHNDLSGPIPKVLGSIRNLYFVNLSFNNLEGEVPTEGVFKNVSAISMLGNNKLCGGNPELRLPACSVQESKRKQSSHLLSIIVPVASVIIIVVFGLFATLCWKAKSKKNTSSKFFLEDGQFRKVSYAELFRATEGFSSVNLIGAGSFGYVYKGKMNSDEDVIAVKVINLQHHAALKSFMAECIALRNIRHRNLVRILTSCSSIDFQGNDFRALVFEFMPNGSLENWLHQASENHPSRKLNLIQRLNIAIDVASALEYLHHNSHSPIIHCDLKPSNILLDKEMTAHLGDFGLARLIFSTNESS